MRTSPSQSAGPAGARQLIWPIWGAANVTIGKVSPCSFLVPGRLFSSVASLHFKPVYFSQNFLLSAGFASNEALFFVSEGHFIGMPHTFSRLNLAFRMDASVCLTDACGRADLKACSV
jgi:hypothetical protein